jgi:hypothetical protein
MRFPIGSLACLGLAVAIVGGCAGSNTHDLGGAVGIRERTNDKVGTQCEGRGTDADIVAGAKIVVRDYNSGNVVARTTLGPGTVTPNTCCFRFRVTVPDIGGYTVQVSDRRPLVRSGEAMNNDDWTVAWTPGSSSGDLTCEPVEHEFGADLP